AALDEETTLVEGEEVQIIEMDDRDWYMARTKSGCGFVPKAYVELLSDMKQQPGTPSVAELEHPPDLTPAAPALPQLPTAPVSAEPDEPPLVQQPPPPLPPPLSQQVLPTPNDTDDAHSTPLSPTVAAPLPPPPLQPEPAIPDSAPFMQPQQQQQRPQAPGSTISHFNVVLGKKKKGKRITLGISNAVLVVDTNEDTVPPKQYATSDIGKCTAKKSMLVVEIGGYEPAAFDITCASNAEAERIGDAINAARRGMFIGDRPLDSNRSEQPPPPPPKDFVQPPPQPQPLAETQKPVPPLPLHVDAAQEFAVMLYDFESQDAEELTVAKDERVMVLEKPDNEWWLVQMAPPHGRKGLVPAAYLELAAAAPTDGRALIDEPEEESTPALPIRTPTVRQAAAEIKAAPQLQSPLLAQ
ncbi:cytoskeletal protein binding protein, partial [Coemansia guatemalensis]